MKPLPAVLVLLFPAPAALAQPIPVPPVEIADAAGTVLRSDPGEVSVIGEAGDATVIWSVGVGGIDYAVSATTDVSGFPFTIVATSPSPGVQRTLIRAYWDDGLYAIEHLDASGQVMAARVFDAQPDLVIPAWCGAAPDWQSPPPPNPIGERRAMLPTGGSPWPAESEVAALLLQSFDRTLRRAAEFDPGRGWLGDLFKLPRWAVCGEKVVTRCTFADGTGYSEIICDECTGPAVCLNGYVTVGYADDGSPIERWGCLQCECRKD